MDDIKSLHQESTDSSSEPDESTPMSIAGNLRRAVCKLTKIYY